MATLLTIVPLWSIALTGYCFIWGGPKVALFPLNCTEEEILVAAENSGRKTAIIRRATLLVVGNGSVKERVNLRIESSDRYLEPSKHIELKFSANQQGRAFFPRSTEAVKFDYEIHIDYAQFDDNQKGKKAKCLCPR